MHEEFDVIVIGGGVNGSGIARDLALRGVKVALLEKTDFSAGATGACSGMIHGGVRYLLHDYKTTITSCRDSGYIQKIAPHLLFRIPFIMPVPSKFMFDALETYFETYDRWVHLKNGKPHTRLSRKEVLKLEPALNPRIVGGITIDEYGIDPFRLTTVNALCAFQHGATILNHTEVIDIVREPESGKVLGVKARSSGSKGIVEYRSRIVMNAGGPWAPGVASMGGATARIRPGKGVHLTLSRRISNVGIFSQTIDGRGIFLMPHENTSIIGTTDDDYYGDLDDIHVTEDEVEYLLQGIERVFPAIRKARILRTWAGIRPTLYKWGPNEDSLSRDHKVLDHEKEGVPGMFSIIGGKLASYRYMSAHAADVICNKLHLSTECTTHIVPLPGGDEEPDPNELAREYNLSPYAVSRLIHRQGSLAREVLKLVNEDSSNRELLCRCEPVTVAEARYVIRNEWVHDLSDLRRRTRFGMGPCQGMRCVQRGAALLAEELGKSPSHAREWFDEFMQRRWKGKAPVLKESHLAQEELNQAVHNS